jgi:hypothetical protein
MAPANQHGCIDLHIALGSAPGESGEEIAALQDASAQ